MQFLYQTRYSWKCFSISTVPTSVDFVRLLADTEKWIEKVQSQPPGGATHVLLIEGILIYNFG